MAAKKMTAAQSKFPFAKGAKIKGGKAKPAKSAKK
jgi:hypothetical protein